MSETEILDQHDTSWSSAAEFMRTIYRNSYAAELTTFPKRILARFDRYGSVLCAAGLRSEADGFFSEYYLDQPIETALGDIVGHPVARTAICEVTTLVSQAPHETSEFVDDIVSLAAELGFRWSFFTLTRRLALMVRHKGLSPFDLAAATAERVPQPEKWGRYYQTSPRVFAVSGGALPQTVLPSRNRVQHAQCS